MPITLQRATPRLRVRDVRRAAEWYRDRLGFAIGEYFPSNDGRPGFVIVERDAARIQLALIPAGEAGANPDGTTNPGGVYIDVCNIDGLYDELKQRGARFLYDIESTAKFRQCKTRRTSKLKRKQCLGT